MPFYYLYFFVYFLPGIFSAVFIFFGFIKFFFHVRRNSPTTKWELSCRWRLHTCSGTVVVDHHKSAFIWVAGSGPLIQERKFVYWYQDVLARGLNASSGAGKPLAPKLT
jgi:hypothetical protein